MVLPQREIVTSAGAAAGIRRFAEAYGQPVIVYLKHEGYLEVADIQRLDRDGVISWIKYAVVRPDPRQDDYLRALVGAVDPRRIVSGIGEQPAVVHLRDFGLIGFTSGCVCVAPRQSLAMLRALAAGDSERAESLRATFQPLEDLRNRIHPIRVLHAAVALAGVCQTGPILPLLSPLDAADQADVEQAARDLRRRDEEFVA
jgi:dihydrodipicolinate synthase/N-acetylneuraminate lyase